MAAHDPSLTAVCKCGARMAHRIVCIRCTINSNPTTTKHESEAHDDE
jgi:hypothetical protein